jgi:hypothetical protein
MKIHQENPDLVEIGQKCRALYILIYSYSRDHADVELVVSSINN